MKFALLLISILFCVISPTYGQGTTPLKAGIKWLPLELEDLPFKFNRKLIRINGITQANSPFKILKIENSENTQEPDFLELDLPSVVDTQIVTSDENGYFSFLARVPKGLTLFTIVTEEAKVEKTSYVAVVYVEQTNVANYVQKIPFKIRKNSLWFGLGFNYHRYTQSTSGGVSSNFDTFTFPATLFFSGSRVLSKDWTAEVSFKSIPGTIKEISGFNMKNNAYVRKTLSTDGIYRSTDWVRNFNSFTMNYGVRSGITINEVPFMNIKGNTVTTELHSQPIWNIGGDVVINPKQQTSYFAYLRYFYPLQSSYSGYTFTPKFSFDGSLGVTTKIDSKWNAGVFWYGEFLAQNLKDNATGLGGNYLLFYTNVEVVMGYSF